MLGISAASLATQWFVIVRPRPAIGSPSRPAPPSGGGELTAQGSPGTRFRRAVETRSVFLAEIALREMGTPPLGVALEYVALLAELDPAKAPRAAVRWHGRLEVETPLLTLAESQLALAALGALCEGDRNAVQLLSRLLSRAAPTRPRLRRIASYGEPQ